MKLSRTAGIAVYAVIYLAEEDHEGLSQSDDISKAIGVPIDTLAKILQQLVRARILVSLRGRTGGFRLARPPSQISLLDVVEAIDGPVMDSLPPPGVKGRRRANTTLNRTLDQTGRALRRILSRTRISELVD